MSALLKHVIYDIRPSDIHGVGLFATQNIDKGTIIFQYPHTRTTDVKMISIKYLLSHGVAVNTIKVLQKWYAHTDTHIQIPNQFDPYSLHIVSLVNHNDNPNLFYKNGKYYAKKNIRANSELTLDYTHNNYSGNYL